MQNKRDKMEICPILGVNIAVTNMEKMVAYAEAHISELSGKYFCVANGHTTVTARESKAYLNVQNTADMILPDGEPLSIVSRMRGFKHAERVTGPDFMEQMFIRGDKGDGLRHFFYGSTQDTLDKLEENLKAKYKNLQIAGMYSPPFRPLTRQEDEQIVEMINNANADIVWIGLGAPRQEEWMYQHMGKLHGLMVGVGAGFDYHAGKLKRAPMWMQRLSLEWLVRLVQDPKRLWKRYLVTNVKFIWYVIREGKQWKAQ